MKNIHRIRARCDWDSSPRRLADGRPCWDTDCMNEPASNQTLDIQGTIISYTSVAWRLGWAFAFVGLGIFLWLQIDAPLLSATISEGEMWCGVGALVSFIIAASLAFPKQTYIYLDFTNRQIVTVNHFAWFEPSRRCRPLTDFSHIVVRHLCHPDGEGGDTYTGSVGLKPVDGRAVLWVKSFPTTQDEVPRTAYEFARKLQEITGLPVAPMGEPKSETP